MRLPASRLSSALNCSMRLTSASARTNFIRGATAVAKQDQSAEDVQKSHTTYAVNSYFINRNPRVLDQLAISRKRLGWDFQAPLCTYWYKVTFEKSSNHIRAAIVHHRDGEVISASTREYAIRKHLFSPTDLCAAETIARILARRSLQFGIFRVFFDKSESPVDPPELQKRLEEQGIQVVQSSLQTFYNKLLESGLGLEEAAVRESPEQVGIDYDALSEAEKRLLRPSLIYQLRTKVDKCRQSRYPNKMRPLPSDDLLKPHRQRLLYDNTSGIVKRRDLII